MTFIQYNSVKVMFSFNVSPYIDWVGQVIPSLVAQNRVNSS